MITKQVILSMFDDDNLDEFCPEGMMLLERKYVGRNDPDLSWHDYIVEVTFGSPAEVCACYGATLNQPESLTFRIKL